MDQQENQINNTNTQASPQPKTHHQTYAYSPTSYAPPKRSGKGKVFFITCGILLLLIACFCSGFVLFSGSIRDLGTLPTSGVNPDPGITIVETTIAELGNTSTIKTNKIAVVDVSGEITYSIDTQTLPAGTSNRTVLAQLRKAKTDSAVKAIIVRFNTPGGAVSAAKPICSELKALDNEKPVYAFIDTEGASLGYLLPNCTRTIYARPEAITGSIGVRADLIDITGIFTNLGARTVTITNTSGSQKTQENLFDKNSAEYKQFQSILDETYIYFLDTVWEGRKDKNTVLTYEKLKSYADGRIFSGKQAKDLGMIDELGQYNEVMKSVYDKNFELFGDSKVQVVEYSIQSNPFSNLFGASSKLFSMVNGMNNVQTRKIQFMMLAEY